MRKVDALFSGEPAPPPPSLKLTQMLLIGAFFCAFTGLIFFLSPLSLVLSLLAYLRCKRMLNFPAEQPIDGQEIQRYCRFARLAIASSLLSLLCHAWLLQQAFYQAWIEVLLESIFL